MFNLLAYCYKLYAVNVKFSSQVIIVGVIEYITSGD